MTQTTTPIAIAIAIAIAEDGKLVLIEWDSFNQDQELDMLRAAIGGGWVQMLRLTPDLDLWVDEDGGPRGLNRNLVAARYAASKRTLLGQLLGKVVITGGVGPEGQTRPLTPAQAIEVLTDLTSAGAVITSKIRASSLLTPAHP